MLLVQYRPAVPAQQFIPVTTQPFQPIGRGVPPMNALPPAPPQVQQPFYSQPTQQFPPRAQDMLPLQTIPLPVVLPNNHPLPNAHPQPSVQTPSNFTPGIGGPGVSFSSSYTVSFRRFLMADYMIWLSAFSPLICNLHLFFFSLLLPMVKYEEVLMTQPLSYLSSRLSKTLR